MDTQPLTETPELVEERWDLSVKVKRIERRLAQIDECLKKRTGERQTGAFWVNVSSSDQERVDLEAVEQILGDATPYKLVPTVRLKVSPA